MFSKPRLLNQTQDKISKFYYESLSPHCKTTNKLLTCSVPLFSICKMEMKTPILSIFQGICELSG